MDTRYRLTETKYGGPAIYDTENKTVAPFVDDPTAQEALLAILDGERSPDVYVWREAYPDEVVF